MKRSVIQRRGNRFGRFLFSLLSMFLMANLCLATVSATVFSNTNPITINDAAAVTPGSPYPSNITVSGMTGNITNIAVTLHNGNHTFPDDIDVLLVAPNGNNLILMSDNGGLNDLMFTNITFDDAAANSLPDSTAIASGSYKPTNIGTGDTFPAPAPAPSANTTLASAFNGITPNGTWSLYVVDDLAGDTGVFGNGWEMTITTSGSAATRFSNYTPIFTNDGTRGSASPYGSAINVTGLTGAITDVNVTLTNVNHAFPDDIDVLLVSPSGKRLIIMSDSGANGALSSVNITLDDQAATDLPDGAGITTGSFRPRNYLTGDTMNQFLPPLPGAATGGTGTLASVFNGTEPNGTWRLYVIDDDIDDAGTIMGGWSLDIIAGGTYGAKRFTSADFDGDGKTDTAVFRPSDSTWYLRDSNDLENRYVRWGTANDRPVPGDYDGDRTTDVAVFRPSTAQWLVLRSTTGTLEAITWGASTDATVQNDYDGDGRFDQAVWRPSDGIWYIRQSSNSATRLVRWGASTDIPVRGHFEGTNGADFTIFRPATSTWFILNNAGSTSRALNFGTTGDKLVPADYDADGKTDVAIFRPSDGAWYILQSASNTVLGRLWGNSAAIPVPGDYDGDSRADIAVFDQNANWDILNSGTVATGNSTLALRIDRWGLPNVDVPLASTYMPPQ